MRTVKRALKILAAAFVAGVYVWVAAVRSVPAVKRRKAARRGG